MYVSFLIASFNHLYLNLVIYLPDWKVCKMCGRDHSSEKNCAAEIRTMQTTQSGSLVQKFCVKNVIFQFIFTLKNTGEQFRTGRTIQCK